MARRLRLFLFLGVLVLLAGCSRVTVDTKLAADGSFHRSVKFSASSPMSGDQTGPPVTPQTVFNIPAASAGVSETSSTDQGAKTVTVARDVPAGSGPITDISVIDKTSSTPAFTSSVSVQKLPDGNLEYVETLHANKHFTTDVSKSTDEMRASIKGALPARFQSTETIDKLTNAIAGAFMHILFGPPEPLIAEALIDPDLMSHKVMSRAKKSLAVVFREQLPELTNDELKSILDKIAKESTFSKNMTNSSAQPSNSDPNEMMPLTFTTTFPGKLVETNGLSDEDSGQVYWSLLAPTLEFGDVKLRLVVDPK
jgi:hypothetical protein